MAGLRQPGGQREVVEVSASVTLSNHDIGKIITTLGSTAAGTITLPDPDASNKGGSIVILNADDRVYTVTAVTTSDKFIAKNNVSSNYVSLATTLELVGGAFEFISLGTKWFVCHMSDPAMTVTTGG